MGFVAGHNILVRPRLVGVNYQVDVSGTEILILETDSLAQQIVRDVLFS